MRAKQVQKDCRITQQIEFEIGQNQRFCNGMRRFKAKPVVRVLSPARLPIPPLSLVLLHPQFAANPTWCQQPRVSADERGRSCQ